MLWFRKCALMMMLGLFSAVGLSSIGCEDEGPAERMGEKIDNAAEEASDNSEEAAEDTADAMEEAADEMEEATDN